jgi:hypothetical protein
MMRIIRISEHFHFWPKTKNCVEGPSTGTIRNNPLNGTRITRSSLCRCNCTLLKRCALPIPGAHNRKAHCSQLFRGEFQKSNTSKGEFLFMKMLGRLEQLTTNELFGTLTTTMTQKVHTSTTEEQELLVN